MRLMQAIVPALFIASLASAATAQDAERYTLEKSGDGFVRMDKTTGAMSICAERSGEMVCKPTADERAALQEEIERLQGAVKTLDARVAKLENSLPARFEQSLPTNEQIDRTVDTMGHFLRGFMGIVKDLENEVDQDAAQPIDPKKT